MSSYASDHNEKYSDRMERSYKAFAVTFELRFPFPLMITIGQLAFVWKYNDLAITRKEKKRIKI